MDLDSVASSVQLLARIAVDGDVVGPVQEQAFDDFSGLAGSVSLARAVEVSAGSRAVSLQAINSDGKLYLKDRTLTTLFVPYGNAGTRGLLGP
jgi:hypothetical protein